MDVWMISTATSKVEVRGSTQAPKSTLWPLGNFSAALDAKECSCSMAVSSAAGEVFEPEDTQASMRV
eukprot:CAMPEP_0115444532 /NCGR_PEP_ID=MMETSP0271-20121206/38444_1 /TAXON_ID=71861 /ORGANISM="Scrippsiella trochoidea, Strain CCMP3099" /LENGTH=66 /DNA_ID=CAMNT_0002870465 /DNA_START=336 /DNA_END=536 /DNA_ORIENTATION=-